MQLRIGVSDCGAKFENYANWLQKSQVGVEAVSLSCREMNVDGLAHCDGLVLTGGDDIHPKYFGKVEELAEAEQVNTERDQFEFALIRTAMENQIPLLGICRGLQIVNVAFGGTLVMDIQRAGGLNHRRVNGVDIRHPISIEQGTLLSKIIGTTSGETNSAHHQAAEKIGEGLKVAAWSEDEIIEALEWENAERKPFLLLVQWHPERMADAENPCTKNILETFLSEVAQRKAMAEITK
jgi:putative glutamine amidotransferase